LREGRDKGEEIKKLREELDKLREEHKSIKDRLVKIEATTNLSTDKKALRRGSGQAPKRISKNGRAKSAANGKAATPARKKSTRTASPRRR
jgi:hypothetical protein